MNAFLNGWAGNRLARFRKHHFFWIIIDLGVVILAYTVAFLARLLADFSDLAHSLDTIFLAALLTSLLLQLNGAYKHLWQQTSGYGVRVLVYASLEATLIITIVDVLPRKHPLPISVVWMGQFISLVVFTALRYRSRMFDGLRWRWQVLWEMKLPAMEDVSRVLVVGAGRSGQLFIMHSRQFNNNRSQFKIIGFADDDPAKQGMLVESTPVLGQMQDISRIAREYRIDLIVLAIHNIASPGFRRIVDICQHTEARIKIMPDVMKALTRSFTPERLRDIRIEDIIGRPDVPYQAVIDKDPISDKVLLVTGAAGSIGSELVRQLIHYAPRNLLLLDNNESGLYDLLMELKQSVPTVPVISILCDVSDQYALRQLFKEYSPQIIFHAAAYKHVPMLEDYPYQAVQVNIKGSFNVVSLAQEYKAERFVLISSDKAVNAENVMGATKYICERVVRSLAGSQPEKTPLISVVRFGNVMGSRGSVVPLFERQIEAGGPVTVTDERMTRYFMSISEAAHLVIQAACMTRGGDLFILEMGESVRIVELAERMIRLRGLRPYQDIPIKFTGVRPGETLHEKLLTAGEIRHSTSHPYIFGVETPAINAEAFMKEVACLLEEHLTGDIQALKQKVLDLAQHAQQEKY